MITEVTVSCANPVDDTREEFLIWNEEGLNEFLGGDGLEDVNTLLEGMQREQEDTDNANQKDIALILFGVVDDDEEEFINDPEIERALDVWRSSGMDDLHEPSYFKEWIGEDAWLTDSKGRPRTFTPEMLVQRDQLNFLCDNFKRSSLISDQLLELKVVAIGNNHGVAKCQYGGVFLTAGVLKYLDALRISEGEAGTWLGDTFKCWITFTNAKYPWRTCVNGVVVE